jgi:hypothetical protein
MMADIIFDILDRMGGVSRPQKKFVCGLFLTILLMRGKVNFRNLSRYSNYHEKTYSRHFRRDFAFAACNRAVLDAASPATHIRIAAMDSSFVPKSGTETYGVAMFYDSSHDQPASGLEVSNLAVVDVTANTAYTLSARQTPAPPELLATVQALAPTWETTATVSRVDFYVAHWLADYAQLPPDVRLLAVDGFYAKEKFIRGVRQTDRHVLGKLRHDAALRHLYTGPQKARGRKRRYAGPVRLDDLTAFTDAGELEPGVRLYTAIVNSAQLRCTFRLVYILDTRDPRKPRYALLFCTDTTLDAHTIVAYYRARFQIEFVFRDAKQFTGLCDCQARDAASLHFHFNASFTTLNLAKLDAQRTFGWTADLPFSLASQKRVYFNEHLLHRVFLAFNLDAEALENTATYQQLRTYGVIFT